MISAISWIPIGASKAEPTVAVPPSKEEIQDIITTVAASTADSKNEEEAGDERMDDAGGAVDEVVRALNVADALRKADKLDDIAFGLKELDMEHYDDEDEGADVSLPVWNYLISVDDKGTYYFAFAGTMSGLSIIGNIQQ